MAISLRSGEEQKAVAHFHWTAYFWPGAWAVFFGLSSLGQLLALMSRDESTLSRGPGLSPLVTTLFVGILPLSIRWLQNKCKSYVLTTQRLYVEDGIVAKRKKDIPLHKINDFELTQSVLQRIFGSGNVRVLTGNDKPTVLLHLHNPEEFRTRASELIGTKQAS